MKVTREQYIKICLARLHELASEEFFDSFSPGDAVPQPKKPVMLPPGWFREKIFLIKNAMYNEGIRCDSIPSDDEIMKYEITHNGATSMSELRPNPATPKIPAEMYENLDYFKALFPDVESQRQFKGAHMSLTNLYLKKRMGLNPRDFEIQGKGESAIRAALLNQYRRYVFGLALAEVLRVAFEISERHVNDVIQKTNVENTSTAVLQKAATRRSFASYVSSLVRRLFKQQSLGEAISQALK